MKRKKILAFSSLLFFGGLCVWSIFPNNLQGPIPVRFSVSNLPIIEITIEGNRYPVELDLGSKFELSLDPLVLKNLYKKYQGNVLWKNITGSQYEHSLYILDKITIGKLQFNNVSIVEMPQEAYSPLWESTIPVIKKESPVGQIGRKLINKTNLLLDFNRGLIFFSNSRQALRRRGYDLSNYLKIPLEITSQGIFLKIETDYGIQDFFLDTGSTWTLLNKKFLPANEILTEKGFPVGLSKRFQMAGQDFGPIKIHFLSIPADMEKIEGILGMGFLKHHILYLDFANKKALLQKSED